MMIVNEQALLLHHVNGKLICQQYAYQYISYGLYSGPPTMSNKRRHIVYWFWIRLV